jgi:hypothetical protein
VFFIGNSKCSVIFCIEFMNKKYFALGSIGVLFFALIALLGVFFFSRFEVRQRAAQTARLTMNPSSQTVSAGQDFTVEFLVDGIGNQINFVGLHVVYDANLLQLVSVVPNTEVLPRILKPLSESSGAFEILLGTNVGEASITGSSRVATATFRARVVSTTTNSVINYSQNSYLGTFDPNSGSANNLLNTRSGATVTISENNCAISFNLSELSPIPTTTLIPTNAPTNTIRPTATNTPIPSATPTNTPRPSPTAPNTPVPTNTPTRTPTPTTPIGPQCIAIKIYRNGEYLSDPRVVQPGQTIVIAVAAGQVGEKARIWINGVGPTEFSSKNANNEFVYTYTIPAAATNISIRAEIFSQGQWVRG